VSGELRDNKQVSKIKYQENIEYFIVSQEVCGA
jgi:hypothetical protein